MVHNYGPSRSAVGLKQPWKSQIGGVCLLHVIWWMGHIRIRWFIRGKNSNEEDKEGREVSREGGVGRKAGRQGNVILECKAGIF